MSNQTEKKPKMIGLDMTNKDRAQATNQTINRFILALVIGAFSLAQSWQSLPGLALVCKKGQNKCPTNTNAAANRWPKPGSNGWS
jgi:hypothetical protein